MTALVEQFPLDLSSLVTLAVQYQKDQYEREIRHLCLHTDDLDRPGFVTIKAGRVRLFFRHLNQATGGARLPFAAKRYGWFVRSYTGTGDGTLRVAYDVLGAELEGVFDFDYRTAFPNDPAGIYRGRILPIDAAGNPVASSECYPPFRFWLDPDHTAKNVLFEIAQNGPWEWIKETDPYNCGASATYPQGLTPTYRGTVRPRLPALAQPRPQNLTPYPDFVFDTTKPITVERLRLSRHNIGGAAEEGNRWYSQMTDRGIWVTDNAQLYYFSQGPLSFVNGKLPIYPVMDGPNGVATVGFTPWNWVGRDRKIYFGSPWSSRVANSTLAVRTLIGIYSVYPAHYADLVAAMQKGVLHPSLRMRGIYPPGTPPLECFPLHSWFMVFLPPTVVQGTGPVRQDSTMLVAESPHPQNPVSVHGDYGHGFVDWFEHDKDDHTVEPRCIYRLPLDGPFGGAYSTLTKKLYVAVRRTHQILEIDPYLQKDANGNYLPPTVRVNLDGGAVAAALGKITPADDTFRMARRQDAGRCARREVRRSHRARPRCARRMVLRRLDADGRRVPRQRRRWPLGVGPRRGHHRHPVALRHSRAGRWHGGLRARHAAHLHLRQPILRSLQGVGAGAECHADAQRGGRLGVLQLPPIGRREPDRRHDGQRVSDGAVRTQGRDRVRRQPGVDRALHAARSHRGCAVRRRAEGGPPRVRRDRRLSRVRASRQRPEDPAEGTHAEQRRVLPQQRSHAGCSTAGGHAAARRSTAARYTAFRITDAIQVCRSAQCHARWQ
jgi:hypothetical protein